MDEDINLKMKMIRLQEEKATLLRKDIDIEEQLLLTKTQLDELMNEKQKLDEEDIQIENEFKRLSNLFKEDHW